MVTQFSEVSQLIHAKSSFHAILPISPKKEVALLGSGARRAELDLGNLCAERKRDGKSSTLIWK